jgi:hypothetical protein
MLGSGNRHSIAGFERLDNGPTSIYLRTVIFTKIFLLKLLLGLGFGMVLLAL